MPARGCLVWKGRCGRRRDAERLRWRRQRGHDVLAGESRDQRGAAVRFALITSSFFILPTIHMGTYGALRAMRGCVWCVCVCVCCCCLCFVCVCLVFVSVVCCL